LGIIVDDTVHFLSRYLGARRELGMDAAEAVRHSFATVGVALVVTSVALFAGFGVLALSGFAISSLMGMLSGITIAFALFADFLFLSPLLVVLDKKTP
jgi:predicted RND superfamily exporter protein